MCQDCGCSDVVAIAINGKVAALHEHEQGEHHDHDHDHAHPHTHSPQTHSVHLSLLSKNDRFAERNRSYFQAKGILTLNILSSPGSGKTALIERMLQDLHDHLWADQRRSLRVGVIVGDLETDNDAQRLRQAGAPAVQITTGQACHLEAEMVAQAMTQLDLEALNVLIIENVGNLVCPAAYDLGETLRAVLLSVTEGEDKPLKYPTMFSTADAVIINKVDIADAVGFNRELAVTNIQKVAPQAQIFDVSARTGQGMAAWYTYLGGVIQPPIEV
ncbi:hydrogenase nickel incorporation protein HypB [Pantanalinema sp. GBBB05]|uniref:hydrogenase nickel incorporation protein HypB n=1 Tax=Pantanalinema sp. GBBB05 TaxID=2604139 RepID=UPI001D416D52|nr:hydrogenase nickel incorporation protein HypB [Pantanalinema sp. GBBB05]